MDETIASWVNDSYSGSIKLLSDSQLAISIAKPFQHDRTKHIEIDKHFIKENLEGGIVEPIYISSSL